MHNLNILQNTIDYVFKDENLLILSLTHASYAHEHNQSVSVSNQRLEFLGDAVLELVSSDFLYNYFKENDEGFLTKNRARLVCASSLASIARNLKLYDYLLIGKGENPSDVMKNDNIMCDTLEALIGAMYLDGGLSVAEKFIKRFVLCDENLSNVSTDYKSLLQEKANRDKVKLKYELIREMGPDHDKSFVVRLNYNETIFEEGFGKTKKEAEQNAAKLALTKIE